MTKPILFNTEMVRKIQSLEKTVTRRAVKPLVHEQAENPHEVTSGSLYFDIPDRKFGGIVASIGPYRPPYRPGDILYVRETWAYGYIERSDMEGCTECWFEECNREDGEYLNAISTYFYRAVMDSSTEKEVRMVWRPSIHMPKEAARLFLRVTKVWRQQLKDVTEADARAEGFGSRAEFVEAIRKMYQDCTEESWFWVIEFEKIIKEDAKSENWN